MRRAVVIVVLAATLLAPRARADVAPDSPVVRTSAGWLAFGDSLYAARRYKESAAAFEQGLLLGADSASRGALGVARAYAKLGNGKQASRWLRHACDLGLRDDACRAKGTKAVEGGPARREDGYRVARSAGEVHIRAS